MKVRIDFVTNSSSESFGVVVVDTIATISATGAALVMIESAKQALIGNSEKVAKELAEAVAKDVAGLPLLWHIISTPWGEEYTDARGDIHLGSEGDYPPAHYR